MKIYWLSCILSNRSWKTANIFDSNFIYKYLTFVYSIPELGGSGRFVNVFGSNPTSPIPPEEKSGHRNKFNY